MSVTAGVRRQIIGQRRLCHGHGGIVRGLITAGVQRIRGGGGCFSESLFGGSAIAGIGIVGIGERILVGFLHDGRSAGSTDRRDVSRRDVIGPGIPAGNGAPDGSRVGTRDVGRVSRVSRGQIVR